MTWKTQLLLEVSDFLLTPRCNFSSRFSFICLIFSLFWIYFNTLLHSSRKKKMMFFICTFGNGLKIASWHTTLKILRCALYDNSWMFSEQLKVWAVMSASYLINFEVLAFCFGRFLFFLFVVFFFSFFLLK